MHIREIILKCNFLIIPALQSNYFSSNKWIIVFPFHLLNVKYLFCECIFWNSLDLSVCILLLSNTACEGNTGCLFNVKYREIMQEFNHKMMWKILWHYVKHSKNFLNVKIKWSLKYCVKLIFRFNKKKIYILLKMHQLFKSNS